MCAQIAEPQRDLVARSELPKQRLECGSREREVLRICRARRVDEHDELEG